MCFYKLFRYHEGKEMQDKMLIEDDVDRNYLSALGMDGESMLEHRMTDTEWWSYIDSCF